MDVILGSQKLEAEVQLASLLLNLQMATLLA